MVTSFPLSEMVQNRDAMGRINKWALELMGENYATECHQVLGTSQFHHGMDRDPNATGTRRSRVLDNVL
jgi:hypothetical protein